MNYFWLSLFVLLAVALWEDLVREKRINELKKVWTDRKNCIGFIQRILDWLFNKITTRQFLNPYFFFPFSFVLTIYLSKEGKLADSMSVILFITFLAIIWYSRETWALRQEQQKNNDIIRGRPILSIIKNVGNTIEIRNDGTNIAYNIQIKFYYQDKESIVNSDIEFSVLGKGLFYKIDISKKKVFVNGKNKELIDLVDGEKQNGRGLVPNKALGVIIEYTDSLKIGKQYKDDWIIDKDLLLNNGEGRFRLVKME